MFNENQLNFNLRYEQGSAPAAQMKLSKEKYSLLTSQTARLLVFTTLEQGKVLIPAVIVAFVLRIREAPAED